MTAAPRRPPTSPWERPAQGREPRQMAAECRSYDGGPPARAAARRGCRRFEPRRSHFRDPPRPEGNYAFFPLLPLVLCLSGAHDSRAPGGG